jgi:diadenylate cyclase
MRPDLGFILELRWQDLLDILIVAYLIYRLALLMRGTRTMQMAFGFTLLALAYVASQGFGLFTLNWLLGNFFGSLIVILVVLFQDDIRLALTQVGAGPFFASHANASGATDALTQAATWLAARRIGGLIAIEQDIRLTEYAQKGRAINASVSAELLETIFMPGSPLHDGAVIIRNDEVVAAACVLPLSSNPDVSSSYGTRHRAALGLSEQTDAFVIVVSEETGRISVARRGRLTSPLEPAALRAMLSKLPGFSAAAGRSWFPRLGRNAAR